MSFQVINAYAKFAKDNARGGQGNNDLVLISGGTDKIIVNNDKVLQSDGTSAVLLSPYTCQDLALISGTTDKILLSGTSDRVLITGYCTSNVLLSQRRLKISG